MDEQAAQDKDDGERSLLWRLFFWAEDQIMKLPPWGQL